MRHVPPCRARFDLRAELTAQVDGGVCARGSFSVRVITINEALADSITWPAVGQTHISPECFFLEIG